jgi:hypothetical protein
MWVLDLPSAVYEHALLAFNKLPSYGIFHSAETPPWTCVSVFKICYVWLQVQLYLSSDFVLCVLAFWQQYPAALLT